MSSRGRCARGNCPLTEGDGRGQRLLELAEISRPGIVYKPASGVALQGNVGTRRSPRQKGRDQQSEVLSPLAEGREPNGVADEAAVEIGAEAAVLDPRRQIGVGGTDHPDVDGDRLRRSHGGHFPLLKDPEESDLSIEGQLRELVEKERPALGRLDETHPIGGGTRECTLPVPEKLTLHQSRRQSTAVDRDKAALSPGLAVEKTGRDLFSRPRLPENEDRNRRGSHFGGVRDDPRHRQAQRRSRRLGGGKRVGLQVGRLTKAPQNVAPEQKKGVAELDDVAVVERALLGDHLSTDKGSILGAQVAKVPAATAAAQLRMPR